MITASNTKRSRSPRRNKTGATNKAVSAAMKAFWNDPERTAEWREKHTANMAARKADPDKSWSRRGVPDGCNREQAATMWAKAQESAKATVAALEARGYFGLDEAGALAKETLTGAIAFMRSGVSMRVRLGGARLVLQFIQGAPARGVTVESAEHQLSEVKACS